MLSELRTLIQSHEGLRLLPYLCPAGRLTIGFGHSLQDKGISDRIALELFEEDLAVAITAADHFWPLGAQHQQARWSAVVDMAFNMGETRLATFAKLQCCLLREDFPAAATEIRESKYAHQVPHRAEINAHIVESGELPPPG